MLKLSKTWSVCTFRQANSCWPRDECLQCGCWYTHKTTFKNILQNRTVNQAITERVNFRKTHAHKGRERERLFADINHALTSTDSTPFFYLARTCTCVHIKCIHTYHLVQHPGLVCAPQTHTSSSLKSNAKTQTHTLTHTLIYPHCLASLCHLVVVSDQLEARRECVCVCVCVRALTRRVCSKGLVHMDNS